MHNLKIAPLFWKYQQELSLSSVTLRRCARATQLLPPTFLQACIYRHGAQSGLVLLKLSVLTRGSTGLPTLKLSLKSPLRTRLKLSKKKARQTKKTKKNKKTKHRAPIQRVVIYSSRYNIQGAFFFLFFFLMGLPLRTDLQQSVTRPLVSCSAASRDTPDGRD